MLPPRVVRRAVGPVLLALLFALGCVSGLVVLASSLAAPFSRRRRVLRLGSFATVYLGVEVAALLACAGTWLVRPFRSLPWWTAVHTRILAWALDVILGAGRRCVGFEVVVDPASDPRPFQHEAPVLVIARHGGPGDSFALVHLLLNHCRRRARIVLKSTLQWDPALDVLLNRLGCCFLPTADAEMLAERVVDLARSLQDHEVLLLFPEGGNWTPERRRRAISRLRRERKQGAVAAALAAPRLLPPRPAGVAACLEARPDLAVVVVAHTGLEWLTTAKLIWEALPFRRPMTVSWWIANPAPLSDEARVEWLNAEWARVNDWVTSHGPAQPDVR